SGPGSASSAGRGAWPSRPPAASRASAGPAAASSLLTLRRRHQLVLLLAGGGDQERMEVAGELGRQAGLLAARQVALAHRLDPVRLHHRDLVLELVAGGRAADLGALAEQAG